MQLFKVNALPVTRAPNAMYIVAEGTDHARIWVTNNDGTKARDITSDVSSFNRYDLTVGTSTGAMNLSASQVFSIDNSTTGTRVMSITNPPAAGRAMPVVVIVKGSAGTVSFPTGAHIADGAGADLGTLRTIFVMLVEGSDVTVTTNLRVNS